MTLKLLRRALLAAATAVAMLLTTTPGVAHAAPGGWVKIQHLGPTSNSAGYGYYLFIAKNVAGRLESQAAFAKHYKFIQKEHGFEIVKDDAVWTCLDSNAAGQVYGLACNGGNYQRWWVISSGKRWSEEAGRDLPAYQIRNLATGLCLDSDSRNVYTLACNGGDYQRWAGW